MAELGSMVGARGRRRAGSTIVAAITECHASESPPPTKTTGENTGGFHWE